MSRAFVTTQSDVVSDADPAESTLRLVASNCHIAEVEHAHVAIDSTQVASLGEALLEGARRSGGETYSWDDPRFWPVERSTSERVQLLAIGNALNFRFWRLDNHGEIRPLGGELHGEYLVGSLYLWRVLRMRFDEDPTMLKAERLASSTIDTLGSLLADDDGRNPFYESMVDRVANIRDLGQVLGEKWDGQFSNLLSAAAGSLPEFLRFSRQLRAYDDPIAKLALVNALMLQGSKLVRFHEPLLPAIDYQLLKQLVRQGVLRPHRTIAHKLRNSLPLEDCEAMELRSAAFKALLDAGDAVGIPGDLVDNQLWHNRTVCSDQDPQCDACPFSSFCGKILAFQRPIHFTRYY